mmetsp:Transcript_10758/g.16209  ORF Transcript_10758/g.16209 Transcript_10758/m.16209 type:complete len:405 (-) Transcript_10758:80-1294(-)|eukprot:CAMPEP_0201507846 /NCGR_PEP_ID=MMETSP0161_2-20130828/1371_1 /ASSEMBLY_ACC=CAM_ASM_000251 /TAXON_ID=180227 /ORGANISM="Neoparamoeba aestuarina, Strain SoJaBio B1-5/56/2" /LENGTH=404 /DNA_ID=CAMNT_0047902321 /DNA_START=144 /DNA_END=1358 /DNA_ORIENTATION=-
MGSDNGKKKQNAAKAPEEPPKQSVLKKLVTRSIVGTAMMFFFYCIIVTKPYVIIPFFVFMLQAVGFAEIISVRYKEVKEKHLLLFRTQCWAWAVIFAIAIYGKEWLSFLNNSGILPDNLYSPLYHYHLWITYSMGICAFMTFILTLQKGLYKYQFSQLSWTMMTIALLVGNLRIVNSNMSYGLFWFVFPASLIICNDCMAYFCGVAFGKKFTSTPFIHLSPNKTWEGFVGAFFCTLIFASWWSHYLAEFPLMYCPGNVVAAGSLDCEKPSVFVPQIFEIPQFILEIAESLTLNLEPTILVAPVQFHAAALAAFASLIAPFGGFFASGMKRAFGLKDFGDYFPGHGGVFDRMDCQLLMHGSVYVHILTFVKAAYMGRFAQVQAAVEALTLAEQMQLLNLLQQRLL